MKAQNLRIADKMQGLWSSLLIKARYFLRKISSMEKYEKIVVIWVLATLVILLLSPVLVLSPNTSITSSSYVFLLSLAFIKSFILIIGSLLAIVLWSFNKKVKIFVIEKLWFQGNKYVITSLLLAVSLSTLLAIWDSVGLLWDYTTVAKLTVMYYIGQILLIVLFAFTLFLIFSSHHNKFRWHVVWYHGKKVYEKNDPDWWLFDEVYHDE